MKDILGELMIDSDIYDNPKWDEASRVHDWRNYVFEELMGIWYTFTLEQKRAIYLNAKALASNEDWD